MRMAVMDVGHVRMFVRVRFMQMRVHMGLARRVLRRMRVLMVLIVNVPVLMKKFLVRVKMGMPGSK